MPSNAVQSTELTGEAGADRYLVPSVAAASRVLTFLASRPQAGASLTEVARELDLAKSTVHGLLFTLARDGLVRRDEGTRRFGLGAALIGLGESASMALPGVALASERAAQLAGELNLTVGVAQITDLGDAQTVDRAYPRDTIHVGVPIGSRYGHFDGAIGKCLLALLPNDVAANEIAGASLPRHTPQSIVTPGAMLAEIERVRSRGWASSLRELRDHNAVAAPVHSAGARANLVLFAVGFPSQLGETDVGSVGSALRASADAIAAERGYPLPHEEHR